MIKNYESFLKEGRFNPFRRRRQEEPEEDVPLRFDDPEDRHHPPNDAVPMFVPGEHAAVDPYGEEEWDENDFSFRYSYRKKYGVAASPVVELNHRNIVSLNGVEDHTDMIKLNLSNNELINLNNLENCVYLKELNLSYNKLTNFDQLNNLIMLTRLEIDSQGAEEPITNVDFVRNLINLNLLSCKGNMITNLDVIKDLPDLKYLYCCPNNFPEEYVKELKTYCDQNGIHNDLKNCMTRGGGYKGGGMRKGGYYKGGGGRYNHGSGYYKGGGGRYNHGRGGWK
jgi:hypothetical protein